MIRLVNVKQYCKEYWKIENYQEAVNDQTQVWDCHHRFEIDHNMSVLELQALGFYFNRPFDELIFLPHKEHTRLHHNDKFIREETKEKMSAAKKGENHPNYGKEGYWKGKLGENAPNYKYHIPEEELYDLYVVQGLNQSQIAEMYSCSQMAICRKLKKFNIKK